MGLGGWQAWLQHTPQKDYFVQCVETDDFGELFARFQEQIEARQPRAVWLRDFYLAVVGKDFNHQSTAPSISLSLDMKLPLLVP